MWQARRESIEEKKKKKKIRDCKRKEREFVRRESERYKENGRKMRNRKDS